jgi:glycosyltransferase involved in cell wall biosynthesis
MWGGSPPPILILGYSYGNHGFARYQLELEGASKGRGKIVTLVNTRNPTFAYPGELVHGRFPVVGKYGDLNALLAPLAYGDARREAARVRKVGGIVHYSTIMPPIDPNMEGVVTVHDLFFTDSNWDAPIPVIQGLRILARFFRHFPNVIAPSEVVRRQLIQFGFRGRISVIHLPVARAFRPLENRKRVRTKWGLPPDERLVLSVSNGRERKNLDAVRRAVDLLPPGYRLVRVGEAISNSLTFRGISDDELNEIYNACDVLLHLATAEGFGRPVIEAMATGLPCVVSDIPVFHETAEGAATFVDPDRSDSVARAICESMGISEASRGKLVQKAAPYNLEVFATKMNDFYGSITGS